LGTALFWVITERVVINYHRRFGNIPSSDGVDGSSHLLRGGSLYLFLWDVTVTVTLRSDSRKWY